MSGETVKAIRGFGSALGVNLNLHVQNLNMAAVHGHRLEGMKNDLKTYLVAPIGVADDDDFWSEFKELVGSGQEVSSVAWKIIQEDINRRGGPRNKSEAEIVERFTKS